MAQTSSIYDHFDLYLTPMTLTFNLPKNVLNGTSSQGQQLCQMVLKSMHYCTSYGPDKFGLMHEQMHGCTHIHQTKIVTTMSRLPASGLDKIVKSLKVNFSNTLWRISLKFHKNVAQVTLYQNVYNVSSPVTCNKMATRAKYRKILKANCSCTPKANFI